MRKLVREQGAITLLVAATVLVNTVLGGSGVSFPLVELALQLVLAMAVVLWIFLIRQRDLASIPGALWALAATLAVIPLLQLVPLPPSVWQALPGRLVEMRSLNLIGEESSWRPLSLVPDATLATGLCMVAACVPMLMVAALHRSGRSLVFGAVTLAAVLSVVWGAGQLAGGEANLFRIYGSQYGFLQGFQNNRNSEADVLLVGMICGAALVRDMVLAEVLPNQRRLVLGAVGMLSLVLMLGVVLTGSRTGMALILPALVAQAVLVRPWLGLGWRWLAGLGLAGVGLAVLAWIGLSENTMIQRAINRFAANGEFRPEIWKDTLYSIGIYAPWGTGMGTFLPVFQLNERLEIVSNMIVNRAHDDYLELALEAGLPGLLVLSVTIVALMYGMLKAFNISDRRSRGQVFCAASVLLVIGAHSLMDYPLRYMSLAGIAALCAAIIINPKGVGHKAQ